MSPSHPQPEQELVPLFEAATGINVLVCFIQALALFTENFFRAGNWFLEYMPGIGFQEIFIFGSDVFFQFPGDGVSFSDF